MEKSDQNRAVGSPSSPMSDQSGSDSDAYNTATARIHFGPLRSPEKKFVPIADRRKTLQPNSRLSTPVPSSPNVSGEDEVEIGERDKMDGPEYRSPIRSRSGTPENDVFLQDEPSSVLATRIIRAHDNPSPPPHALGTISPNVLEFDIVRPLNIPANAFMSTVNIEEDVTPELGPALYTDEPTPPAMLLRDRFPFPSVELTSNGSQHDLTSFNSFGGPLPASDIPTLDASLLLRSSSTLAQPSSRTDRSVDDLLSHSPTTSPVLKMIVASNSLSAPLLPSSPTTPCNAPNTEASNKDGDLADSADEQAIENALTHPEVECLSRSTSPLPRNTLLSPSKEGEDDQPQLIENVYAEVDQPSGSPSLPIVLPPSIHEDGELPQTPIRRSTRPRRSGTPYSFRIYSPQTPPQQSHLLAPPPSVQTQRKKKKGKERAIFSGDELASDSQSGENRSRSTSAEPSSRTKESLDVSPQDSDLEGMSSQESEKKGKKREGGKSGKMEKDAVQHALNRKLRSLSPDSATLLTQLVPSAKTSPLLQETDTPEDPTMPQPPAFSFSVFPRRQETTFVMQRAPVPETPVRFTSPVRFASSRSPSKVQSAALNDSDRTPARRIPIEQAIAQGQISPQKAAEFNKFGTSSGIKRNPVFARPTSTPARRVPLSETTPIKAHGSRQASPVRGLSKEPSGSIVSKSLGKGRSGSAEQQETRQQPWGAGNVLHARPQSTTPGSGSSSKLPFAIVPAQGLPNPIPEENEGASPPPDLDSVVKDNNTAGSTTNSIIAKSNLRQASIGSRIPRIGLKPYARPAMAKPMENNKGREKSSVKRTVDLRATVNPSHMPKPFRIVGSGSGSSSDDIAKNVQSADIGPTLNTAPGAGARTPSDTSVTTNLKRKRTDTQSPMKQAHPTIIRWQIGSGPHNSKQTSKVVAKTTPAKKTQEPLHVDRDLGVDQTAEVETTEVPVTEPRQIDEENDLMSGELSSGDLTPSLSSVHVPSAKSRIPRDKGSNSGTSIPSEKDSGPLGRVRRTTRQRKPAHPSSATDVFGTVNVRPLEPRRKAPTNSTTQTETGAFSSMSAVALKALTSSNTARNQKYLTATLQTEIIRKEGARPESPTVKVRTLLQRQKEEKGKQRMERAARRARRSEDGSGMSDTDGQSDPVDSSLADMETSWDDGQDDEVVPRKHRRGPGDEEDYNSPDKPERPAKRLKFEEGDEENTTVEKRRVKWDHGLSSTIFLDEVRLGTRARPKENVDAKGCLTKTAKAIRLDTLGNLPNADSPLTDLVHENIIVKKFVYDNDAAPTEDTEEVYIVRGTRSRSRKAKS